MSPPGPPCGLAADRRGPRNAPTVSVNGRAPYLA
jgi:hypothetical protein